MEVLESVAGQMDELLTNRLSLICNFAHFSVVILGIKQTWGETQSRSQPFATWFMSMICCFGGGCLVHVFVGKPLLTPFTNTEMVILATIVWWLVFYAPADLFHSFLQPTPVKIVFLFLKEMLRTRKIMKGVALAREVYPSSLLLCTALGMLGACGGGFIKNTALLLRATWNQESIKTFSFSVISKCCLLFAALYNLQLDGQCPFSAKVIALLQTTTMFSVVVGALFGFQLDFFSPLEGTLSSTFVNYSAFSSSEQSKGDESESKSKKKKGKSD
ncbi:trimeric intracellular cation channel type B-A-like [Clavelina lepadiformis]|uniref:Trimeric intracellular cation channel type B n=1 Tax=Clavelina lepadiformis TaxID=159417 RepID=A0ABP0FM77_CLALP